MSRRTPTIKFAPGHPDFWLLGSVIVLVIIGLIFVYSASFAQALVENGTPRHFVIRQAVWAVVGIGLMFGLMRVPYPALRAWSPILMVIALAALIAVLIPGIGIERNGARRWLGISEVLSGQPSEFAKLVIIIYVSAWLAAKGRSVQRFFLGFVPFVIMVGTVSGLIYIEPDLGTMLVVVITTMTLFFYAGASLSHLATMASIASVTIMVLILTGDYQKDRFMAFTSPESDPTGAGFHTLQMLIALGSGGITGLGLGDSRQKFFYVPGAHTDGIFAIIGEEMGFIGAVLFIVLYLFILYRGFRIAMYAMDEFGAFMAVGITCWFGFQTFLNIGGVTHSIPLAGIPIPFVSYGGSALAASMAGVGLLLGISRWSRERVMTQREAPPPTSGMKPQRQVRPSRLGSGEVA